MPADKLAELQQLHGSPGQRDRRGIQTGRQDADMGGMRVGALLRERSEYLGLLDDLAENERRILVRRFGLASGNGETLDAISRDLGLTRERVRQLEAAGLRKLRALLGARGVDIAEQA
jgi:DNA-directed RNA polymerase specialized sigma subunit